MSSSHTFIAISMGMTTVSCLAAAIDTDLRTREALQAAVRGERVAVPDWRMGLDLFQKIYNFWLLFEVACSGAAGLAGHRRT